MSELQRALDGLAAAWRRVCAREGEWLEIDGWSVATNRVAHQECNQAYLTRPATDPDGAVAAVIDAYRERGVPFKLQIPADFDPATEEAIARHELRKVAEGPLMVLTPIDGSSLPRAAQGLQLQRAGGPDATAAGMVAEVFGLPADVIDVFLAPAIGVAGGTWVVGSLGGQPAAAAMSLLDDGAAGVFAVATAADHRRRGFGAAVTAEAIRAAHEAGADLAFLQSSRLGFGVYQAMGFRPIGSHLIFRQDAPTDGAQP